MTDSLFMARALALAERGRGRTSPNPLVGAVVVDDDGVVVGRGAHEVAGGAHAEIHALNDAGPKARGATLYCTLEPCNHTGRTGPCAPCIVAAGIRRVVVAVEDPNPLVSGRGIAHLRERGVEVCVGVLRREAQRQNRPFFTVIRLRRPYVTMKIALSLEAWVAARGTRTSLTGAAANRFIHRDRAEIDAIAVGSGTVLADDPLLTARGAYRSRPLARVIFDRRLRTPDAARVFSTADAGPVIIVSTVSAAEAAPRAAKALQQAGAVLELFHPDATGVELLESALANLATRGVTSLVVEGGPTLHRAFWEAHLVDRVQMFVTPKAIGADGVEWLPLPMASLAGLVDVTAAPIGEDVLIEGHVHRTD